MSEPIHEPTQEFYSKRENCLLELGMARQSFGDVRTTDQKWQAIDRALALMYFYCPADLQDVVWLTMLESTRRQSMLLIRPLTDKRPDCPICQRPNGVAKTNGHWRCHMVAHPQPVVCV